MASRPQNAQYAQHERDDVSVRGIGKVALALFASVGVCAGLVLLLVALFSRAHERELPAAAAIRPPAIAGEVPLTSRPAEDLAAFRVEKAAMLHRYRWIDKEHGVVQIPVERAMQLLVEAAAAAPAAESSR